MLFIRNIMGDIHVSHVWNFKFSNSHIEQKFLKKDKKYKDILLNLIYLKYYVSVIISNRITELFYIFSYYIFNSTIYFFTDSTFRCRLYIFQGLTSHMCLGATVLTNTSLDTRLRETWCECIWIWFCIKFHVVLGPRIKISCLQNYLFFLKDISVRNLGNVFKKA